MNTNKDQIAGNTVEEGAESVEAAVSGESQEAALVGEAEGAKASLQDEIDSMEQMIKDMPDMDAETMAMMQGQIDEMKTELEEDGMRLAPGEPSMKDFKARLVGYQDELKNAEPGGREADNIQHRIWQTESQMRDLQFRHNQKKNSTD